MALYDTIGIGYAGKRRSDPRIAAQIDAALKDAHSVLNVGAGAGSYEPRDRRVTAAEIALTMIRQRPAGTAPVVQASALALPFRDNAFDAALASLTVHHWGNAPAGLREVRRVAHGPVVLFTWDPHWERSSPDGEQGFWLSDYIGEVLDRDRGAFPLRHVMEEALGPLDIRPVPIPQDCLDGFMCSYWKRPAAYLDPNVRRSISTFSKLGDVSDALRRLERDLESGAWEARYAHLLEREALDLGYRLVVATGGAT